ncbi:MAG: type II toxin-antitoxin system RelE/ParE family toxin [Candidatus Hydrogenedentes bacterium]|nr:type II toxin-antitoxin system RelE/ParE family toxin [Candidatus Hydrogenedentota bacterium]
MVYRIVITEHAYKDYLALDAWWRAMVRYAMHTHLIHQPMQESKSRIKKLRDYHQPEFRLRVDNLCVLYDVAGTDVVVLAIMPKEKMIQWLETHGRR